MGETTFEEELLEVFGGDEVASTLRKKIRKHRKEIDVCAHLNCFEEHGQSICRECGHVTEVLNFDPEWRHYGDDRGGGDPSRCHRSKPSELKSIEKVFVDCKLEWVPTAIRKKVERKYQAVVGEETVRGQGRRAIVAACTLFVFRAQGDIRDSEEIRTMFKLTKKTMSSGLHRYYEAFPEDRLICTRPKDLIYKVLKVTEIPTPHLPKILSLALCLENTDLALNHSNPWSVATSIVYLYLCLHPRLKKHLNLSKTAYAGKADVSDLTITKLSRRAALVLGAQLDV